MLLDEVLPEYDAKKRHAISIAAPPHRVYEEVLRYDFASSRVTAVLMTLRGYARRRGLASRVAPGSLRERLEGFAFTLLAEEPGEEIVFGLVGRFWRADGDLQRVSAPEFASFREPGFAKAAWNLRVGPGPGPPLSELSTETRVQCLGEDARRKFLRYWRLVEPFSGSIRRSMLRGVRRAATRPKHDPTSSART